MKKFFNAKTLLTWAIVAVVIYFSMWNEFWLMTLGVLIVIFQLHAIIQLLKEQNELLRQKNEKQE